MGAKCIDCSVYIGYIRYINVWDIKGTRMMNVIHIKLKDIHYNCPFSGSCNCCNLLSNQGMNTCPGWDDEKDDIITPIDCPLLKESQLIKGV